MRTRKAPWVAPPGFPLRGCGRSKPRRAREGRGQKGSQQFAGAFAIQLTGALMQPPAS